MIGLQTMINEMILNHPRLYRCRPDADGGFCPRNTRLMALDNLLLTAGTECEWHPDGFMHEEEAGRLSHRELPGGFFEVDFFGIDVRCDRHSDFEAEFGHLVFYANAPSSDKRTFFFREEMAAEERERMRRYSDSGHFRVCHVGSVFSPYPISSHSPLMQAIRGKTENDVPFRPLPDWIGGILEIAQETIRYYEGPCKPYDEMSQKTFESFKAKQIAICRTAIEKFTDGTDHDVAH